MTIQNMANSRDGYPYAKNIASDINGNDFAAIVPVIPGQIGGRESNIVSAKALHKALGVGNDFSTWLKLRIDEYGFVLGTDYAIFDSSNYRNQSADIDQQESGWVSKRGGDRRSKDYGLSLGMAKELAMVERNEQGRQLKARIGAANMFKPMCSTLDVARAEQGKQTLPRHYTNESNMLARIVLGGLTAKQWAQINNIDGEPRDSMNTDQLDHLAYLESTNITLIDMGMDYHPRKGELERLSQRWLAKRLGVGHV